MLTVCKLFKYIFIIINILSSSATQCHYKFFIKLNRIVKLHVPCILYRFDIKYAAYSGLILKLDQNTQGKSIANIIRIKPLIQQ